MHTIYS